MGLAFGFTGTDRAFAKVDVAVVAFATVGACEAHFAVMHTGADKRGAAFGQGGPRTQRGQNQNDEQGTGLHGPDHEGKREDGKAKSVRWLDVAS